MAGCFAGFLAVGLADIAAGLTGFADFPVPDLVGFAGAGLSAGALAAFSFAGLSAGAALAADFAVLPRLDGRIPNAWSVRRVLEGLDRGPSVQRS